MKKVLLIAAFIISASVLTQAQSLKSGSMISIHTVDYTPNSGYEKSDIVEFLENQFYPAFAKELNCEIKLIKGLNRETENKIGVIYYYTSKQHFNKFWNDDGSPTEKGQEAIDSLQTLRTEFRELGSSNTSNMQDWIVK